MAESAGVTPRDVSDVVREELRSQGLHAALSVFESRLAAGGFLEAEADLSLRFRIDEVRYYRIEFGFPAITRAMLPKGVAEARYDIELGALLPFTSSLSA